MNETLKKCRAIFGYDGAATYLRAQLDILSGMRERNLGDDDDDER